MCLQKKVSNFINSVALALSNIHVDLDLVEGWTECIRDPGFDT